MESYFTNHIVFGALVLIESRWPSGLRRCVKVAVSPEAWVRIPLLTIFFILFFRILPLVIWSDLFSLIICSSSHHSICSFFSLQLRNDIPLLGEPLAFMRLFLVRSSGALIESSADISLESSRFISIDFCIQFGLPVTRWRHQMRPPHAGTGSELSQAHTAS